MPANRLPNRFHRARGMRPTTTGQRNAIASLSAMWRKYHYPPPMGEEEKKRREEAKERRRFYRIEDAVRRAKGAG